MLSFKKILFETNYKYRYLYFCSFKKTIYYVDILVSMQIENNPWPYFFIILKQIQDIQVHLEIHGLMFSQQNKGLNKDKNNTIFMPIKINSNLAI